MTTDQENSQTQALRLLKSIYDRTRGGIEPVFVEELTEEVNLTVNEAKAAWHYLKDGGLIKTFSIPYTARINDVGIRAIEDAKRDPDHPSRAFPSITYNIVNNTTHIGSATNSPVQQGGINSSQNQNVQYTTQDKADLIELVGALKSHFSELELNEQDTRRARAQLATLEAQLADDPNPVIVKEAGKTLRNITEGVIGGLITTAVQPAVWVLIAALMEKLFAH